MIYLLVTVLATALFIEYRKRRSDAMVYQATIDDLRRESLALVERTCANQIALAKSAGQFSEWLTVISAENHQLRARIAELEAPVDYLEGAND